MRWRIVEQTNDYEDGEEPVVTLVFEYSHETDAMGQPAWTSPGVEHVAKLPCHIVDTRVFESMLRAIAKAHAPAHDSQCGFEHGTGCPHHDRHDIKKLASRVHEWVDKNRFDEAIGAAVALANRVVEMK